MDTGAPNRIGLALSDPVPPLARLAAPAILLAFAAIFLIQLAPRITAPFGDSHDGRNGGVWGMAGRAIRTDGLVRSRIGARVGTGSAYEETYAHHPPLISVETAAAQAVFGDNHVATRAPAWLGSLVLIGLTYRLIRRCGLAPLSAAAGTALGLGTPMFFVFGGMLDTPVTSLPFATGLALVCLEALRRNRRTCRSHCWLPCARWRRGRP